MKFVIQRVLESKVTIDGETVGSIGRGLMVLIGIGRDDTKETADKFVRKMIGLRIFEDEEGKTNLALKDVDGQLLLISQFTLYADCRRGNRPGFTDAAPPAEAEALYDYIVDACRREVSVVQTGAFGADMKVSLVNDGPFTIVLDESILKKGRQ
ncbi:MAG: D-aminoacyl-tRNA deacylase [Eubacteriales bacterium]|nr:D-aminoacyl-tRNA deacylase [Eubacteriales bacterium]